MKTMIFALRTLLTLACVCVVQLPAEAASGTNLYVFTYDRDRSQYRPLRGPAGIDLVIAASNAEAAGMVRGKEILQSIDNDKCKTGWFLLGVNNFLVTQGGQEYVNGIAAYFLACNFKNLDEVLEKGMRQSGRPFFNYVIGEINGPAGQTGGSIKCRVMKGSKQWEAGANVGIEGYPGNQRSKEFCGSLNTTFPVLLDREPQEVIKIVP